jgi:diguanylate cyclase (GGDEF)-like protein
MVSRRLPLRPLAFLAGACLAGLVAGADSWLLVQRERAAQLSEADAALAFQADLLAERLSIGMGTWRQLLGAVGALDALKPGGEATALSDALADLVTATADLHWLGLFDPSGRLLGASAPVAAPPGALAAAVARGDRVGVGEPLQAPDGISLDFAVRLADGLVLAGRVALGWAERLRVTQQARSLRGVTLSIHAPDAAALLPRALPAMAQPIIERHAPIGATRFTARASLSESAALAPLRAFALRLGAGALAVALAAGVLAAALAHLAQRALAASRARAEHDPLTGLRNRAGLAAWEAAAKGRRMAVVALDLDGFKPINDTHGHAVGDEVLRGVADAMRARLRPGDAAVRIGGDEFLFALLPRAGEDAGASAESVAWRLIRVLAEGVETAAGTLPVGASAGVALVPEDAPSLAAAQALADAALYEAKRAGKRTVLRASPG